MQRGMDVEKMHLESSRATLIKMGIILVVLVAIVGGYLLFRSKQSYTTIQAPSGEVVAGFPKELIVEKGVTIQDSYSLAYAAGLNQPVVTYVSNWPMIQNVAQFGAYLRNNGWTITHEADPLAKNTFYYATKDNSDVNITLADSGRAKAPVLTMLGTVKSAPSGPIIQVTISYIKR
jgi:hypothetical protein